MTISPLSAINYIRQLVRFYGAAALNTMFGIALFYALIWLGMGRYSSQLVSHIIGATFNYYSYSRLAFDRTNSSTFRFFLSYLTNYLLGLGFLYLYSLRIYNPYTAGAMSLISVSIINFLILKYYVFREIDNVR